MRTIQLKDRTVDLFSEAAKARNITLDELLDELAEMLLDSREEKFEAARKYVRTRYKELYKRLA